jgi:hypothetical protein
MGAHLSVGAALGGNDEIDRDHAALTTAGVNATMHCMQNYAAATGHPQCGIAALPADSAHIPAAFL